MKKLRNLSAMLAMSLILILNLGLNIGTTYASEYVPQVNTKASILIDMDSGTVLHENNATAHLPIASVVKLMTVLLVLEELDAGNINIDDMVSVSENASGMGGSQIFLDANCEYELGQLLKSVIVCSANDSSVALAELIAGSETQFVQQMNNKASQMGLENTNYVNCTGLPAENQYSCALDVAKILQNVLKYDRYHEYSKIWLEDFVHPSGRTTEMTNTNRLSRFYEGCIGGKTGSTAEAGYCLAVGAKRGNLSLISVVLGASSTKDRFKGASDLLNYGFANYENTTLNFDDEINIVDKDGNPIKTKIDGTCHILSKKGEVSNYEVNYYLPTQITTCSIGQELGYIEVVLNGELYSTLKVLADQEIRQPSFKDNFHDILEDFI